MCTISNNGSGSESFKILMDMIPTSYNKNKLNEESNMIKTNYREILDIIINGCNNYYSLENKNDNRYLFKYHLIYNEEGSVSLKMKRLVDNEYKEVYGLKLEGNDIDHLTEIAFFRCLKDCFAYYVK